MVIFGASGDLTKRMLLPSLYHLAKKKLLPKDFALVGCAIDEMSEEEYRNRVRADLQQFAGAPDDCKFCDWLIERLYYLHGDFQQPETLPAPASSARNHRREARHRRQLPLLPGHLAHALRRCGAATRRRRAGAGIGRPLASRGDRETLRPRPGIGEGSQSCKSGRCSPSARFIASITTWAKRPSRIF